MIFTIFVYAFIGTALIYGLREWLWPECRDWRRRHEHRFIVGYKVGAGRPKGRSQHGSY